MQHKAFIIVLLWLGTFSTAYSAPTFFISPLQQVDDNFSFGDTSLGRNVAINNQGHVVFIAQTPSQTEIPESRFVKYNPISGSIGSEQVSDLTLSSVNDLSNLGKTAGSRNILESSIPALLDNEFEDIPLLANTTTGNALGVNDSGHAVGYLENDNQIKNAFLYDGEDTEMLGAVFGGIGSMAYDINNNGVIVGKASTSGNTEQAFQWVQGLATNIGLELGADSSTAFAINQKGDIIGTFNAGGIAHSFIRNNDLSHTDLNTKTIAGTPLALGLNDAGDVVGILQTDSSSNGFMYTNESLVNLNEFLPSNTPWTIVETAAINNNGEMVGITETNGRRFASLLTPSTVRIAPIPEIPGKKGHQLGQAVATNGKTLAARTSFNEVIIYDLNDNGDWEYQQSISSNTGSFGVSIAMTDDTLAIGSPLDDNENGNEAGAVYLYKYIDGTWKEYKKIIASNGIDNDDFGRAIALHNTILVVGAPSTNKNPGAAYIFSYKAETNTWHENQLTPSSIINNDQLGLAVAISNDFVITTGTSGVRVFKHIDGLWHEDQVLSHPPWWSRNFGEALAIDGNRLAIGAPGDDQSNSSSTNEGAVYLYERNNSGWHRTQRLTTYNYVATNVGEFFGQDLILSNDLLIVGAHRGGYPIDVTPPTPSNVPNEYTGAVYIFGHNGKRWVPQAELLSDDSDVRNWGALGTHISFANDTLVAGASWHSHEDNRDSGAVYSWHIRGSTSNPFQPADLDVSVLSPMDSYYPTDSNVTITVELTNFNENVAALNTQISLTIQDGIDITNLPTTCRKFDASILCNIGDIEPKQQQALSLTFVLKRAGLFNVTITANAITPDPELNNNHAETSLFAVPNVDPQLIINPVDTWEMTSAVLGQNITAKGIVQNWLVPGSQRKIVWYVDDEKIGESTNEPNQFELGFIKNGDHTLRIELYDDDETFSGHAISQNFTVQSGIPSISFLNLSEDSEPITAVPNQPIMIELLIENWAMEENKNGLTWTLNNNAPTLAYTDQFDINAALFAEENTTSTRHTLTITLVNTDGSPVTLPNDQVVQSSIELSFLIPGLKIDDELQSVFSEQTTTLSANIIKDNWPYKIKWSIEEANKSGVTDNRIIVNIEDLSPDTYTLTAELVDESGQPTGIKDSKQFQITMSDDSPITALPPKELEGGGGSISWLIMALAGLLAGTRLQR